MQLVFIELTILLENYPQDSAKEVPVNKEQIQSVTVNSAKKLTVCAKGFLLGFARMRPE
jgi:hypothetical protein